MDETVSTAESRFRDLASAVSFTYNPYSDGDYTCWVAKVSQGAEKLNQHFICGGNQQALPRTSLSSEIILQTLKGISDKSTRRNAAVEWLKYLESEVDIREDIFVEIHNWYTQDTCFDPRLEFPYAEGRQKLYQDRKEKAIGGTKEAWATDPRLEEVNHFFTAYSNSSSFGRQTWEHIRSFARKEGNTFEQFVNTVNVSILQRIKSGKGSNENAEYRKKKGLSTDARFVPNDISPQTLKSVDLGKGLVELRELKADNRVLFESWGIICKLLETGLHGDETVPDRHAELTEEPAVLESQMQTGEASKAASRHTQRLMVNEETTSASTPSTGGSSEKTGQESVSTSLCSTRDSSDEIDGVRSRRNTSERRLTREMISAISASLPQRTRKRKPKPKQALRHHHSEDDVDDYGDDGDGEDDSEDDDPDDDDYEENENALVTKKRKIQSEKSRALPKLSTSQQSKYAELYPAYKDQIELRKRCIEMEEVWAIHDYPNSDWNCLVKMGQYICEVGVAAKPFTKDGSVHGPGFNLDEAHFWLCTEKEYHDEKSELEPTVSSRGRKLLDIPALIRDDMVAYRKHAVSQEAHFTKLMMNPDFQINVQCFEKSGQSVGLLSVEAAVDRWNNPNGRPPMNLLNLQDWSSNLKPDAFGLPECNLLAEITTVTGAEILRSLQESPETSGQERGVGKKAIEVTRPTDIQNCNTFRIASQAGSLSGFHIDMMGPVTWVRVIRNFEAGSDKGQEHPPEGICKLWNFLDISRITAPMRDALLDDFSRSSHTFIPRDYPDVEIVMLGLKWQDTLVMPPGLIHAPFSVTDVAMAGGMIMDAARIMEHLRWWIFTAEQNHTVTNEDCPKQTYQVLQHLRKMLQNNQFPSLSDDDVAKAMMQTWQICGLTYNCSCPTRSCGSNCPCRLWEVPCGLMCHATCKEDEGDNDILENHDGKWRCMTRREKPCGDSCWKHNKVGENDDWIYSFGRCKNNIY